MDREPAIDIERAIDAFVAGWTRVRRITHPYIAERIEGVWIARDQPAHPRNTRNEEFITHGLAPAVVDRIARENAMRRYKISVIRAASEPEAPLRAAYRSLGYRLLGTEGLFVHTLRRIAAAPASSTADSASSTAAPTSSAPSAPVEISRVTTPEQAAAVAKAARKRQLLPGHLNDPSPAIRLYAAMDGAHVAGWVSSVTAGAAAWCANLFVEPSYRRQGIGRALMTRVLHEDRERGFTASVLLASHAGALLYPGLGYQRIGELCLFGPAPAAR